MARIPIVDTIIERDGKLLMLKRNFEPKDKLDILGGFVDKGESIKDAAIREVKEESGFDVKLIKKLGTYDYLDKEEKIAHVFIGKIIGGKLKRSVEGEPLWIDITTISIKDLACPQKDVRILNDYFKFKGLKVTLRH